jgi:hypothetical protein
MPMEMGKKGTNHFARMAYLSGFMLSCFQATDR